MEFLELLAYYHWVIIAFGFFLLRVFKLDGLSVPGTFAGVMMAVVTYISPDIYWGWQIWGFVLITAISAIPYLRQQQRQREEELDAIPTIADKAAFMTGTTVTLEEPVASGHGKLLINGKYWHVSATRDYPAGTIVEVVGHEGATLKVMSTDKPSYGISTHHSSGNDLPVSEYERDADIEAEYGRPNFDAWVLFQAALKSSSKQSLVQAYHLLCALRGKTLADAKRKLNTFTLALYDTRAPGRYIDMYSDMYCDARHYDFFYGDGEWFGSKSGSFEKEMQKLEAALETPWADLVRGTIPSEQVEMALRALRESG
jgi:membrane protein implicated in regulation of membrane protease activity